MERCFSTLWILYIISVCSLKRTYGEPGVCPPNEPSQPPVGGNAFNSKGRLYAFSLRSLTGDVFVGGEDSISKLSSNLTVLQTYTYPDTKGSLMKLLLIDEKLKVLVACGTDRQGICFRHSLDDITANVVAVDGSDKASGHIVSSSGSSVGLVASDQELHSDFKESVFYFGRTLDADLPYVEQQSVSTKIWNSDMDGFKLASNYSTNHTGKYSEISVSKQFANSYKIDYLYTFMHNGFVYFVTKQPKKLGSSMPEVRLVRICSLDVGYYSYMELTLSCKSKVLKGPSREPIDAYFSTVSSDFTARHKLGNDSLDILFLLCGREGSDGTKMVCPFTMKDIDASFEKAKRDCQNEFSYKPGLEFMFDDEPRICIPTHSDDVETCPATPGHLDNIHVEKNLSSKNILLDALGDDLATSGLTSIAVGNYRGHTILVGGTASGEVDVFNIGAFSKLGTPRKRVKLSNEPIGQHLDVVDNNIFAMTDRSLHMIPLSHFCRTATSCRECVLTSYLQCGYCTGHGCMAQNECDALSGSWSRTACPTTVSAVFPKTRSGPLRGGTEITICGEALGHTTPDPSKPSLRELSLGDYATCTVDGTEDYNSMSCKVSVANVTNQGRIRVPVTLTIKAPLPGLGYEFERYKIDTKLNLGSFDFYRVNVNGFLPKKGSEAGGTVLKVSGQHLDVGSSVLVTVGDAPCIVFSRNASTISCVTSARNATTFKRAVKKDFHDTLAEVKAAAKPSAVKVAIDDAVEVVPGMFSYMPAPSLALPDDTVFRSIYSGGIHILVMGANLESVANPYVTVEFKKLNMIKNITCTVVSGPSGSLRYLQFLTPALRSNRSIEHGTVTFHLDGLTQKSSIIALPDPKFAEVDMEESSGNGKILVMARGEDVERICQRYTGTFKKCDYTMYIGDLLCPDLTPTKNVLACTVERSVLEKQSDTKKRNVTVKVGVNLTIHVGEIDLSTTNVAMVGAIVGVVIVLCIVACVVLMMKRRKKKRPSASDPVHYDAHASSVQTGNPYHGSSIRNENGHHSELSPLLSGASLRERLSPEILDEMSPLLINPDQVRYDRDDIIGKGNFGIVFHGVYCQTDGAGESQDVKVAIKTMSRIEDLHTVEQFLQEALIMKDFKDEHVLTLIGVLMDENSCPMVVLPFMKHGDLLMFIRNPENKPTVKDLVGFGLQACRGMKYLASNRFVHRDLAARNCMLDEDYTVKVADFGLARDIYEKEYYKPHDRIGRMPVKWMALESLQQQKFTTKTDVWSFGILMWELVTRGVTPYPDVDAFDVLEYLLDGRRLKQPEFCPDELYQIILRCWNPLPEDRPTFSELVTLIADIHKNIHGVHYPGLNVTYVNLDVHPYPSQIRSSESRSTGASDVFTPGTQTTFVRSPTGPTPPPRNAITSHDGVFSPEVPLLPRSGNIPEDEEGYLLPSISGTPKLNEPAKVAASQDQGAARQHVMRVSENNGEIPNSASPGSNGVGSSQQRGVGGNVPASAVNPSLRKQDSFVVPPSPLQEKRSPKIRPPVAPKPKYINEAMGSHRPLPASPETRYQNIARDSPEFLSNPTYMDREELLKAEDDASSKPSRNRNNGNNRKESEERYISNPRLSAALEPGYVELANDHSPNETEEV